jgi:hypothetical protein
MQAEAEAEASTVKALVALVEVELEDTHLLALQVEMEPPIEVVVAEVLVEVVYQQVLVVQV